MEHRMYFRSPVGLLAAVEEDGALTRLYYADSEERGEPSPLLESVASQLEEYFAGRRRQFDLPLAPRGTAFQRGVWEALLQIPYGSTCSYGELAARVGLEKGSRAVGGANGRNPIVIVIPCHRVIAADGGLGGYTGGIARKRALLDIEGALCR